LIVVRERGELEKRRPDDDCDELDGHGHEQALVDEGFQVRVVGQQQDDGDDGYRGRGEVDVPDPVTDIVVGEHDLEQPVVVIDLDAQQLLHLGRDHVDGRAGREPADQRLGQYRAHDAQPKHVHEQLHEPGHHSDGGGHLDGRVTGPGVGPDAVDRVHGHYFSGHQAKDGQHAQRYVTGRSQQAVHQHREHGHVKADGRLDVAEYRVGHTLRDVQHGHRDAGHRVLREVLGPAVVEEQPVNGRYCLPHVVHALPFFFGWFLRGGPPICHGWGVVVS